MKELEKEFIGIGEARGDKFTLIKQSQYAYLFKRFISEQSSCYEVFKRVEQKEEDVMLKGVLTHMEAKVIYPKASQFGISAWCVIDYDRAEGIFDYLTKRGPEEDDKKNERNKV